MVYVDLNPIRAALAKTPEGSPYTSVADRIRDLQEKVRALASAFRRNDVAAGPLPISLENYTEIVDWTGRQLRADKRGAIPEELAPILDRLGLRIEAWMETVTNFGKWFGDMVGKAAAMKESAARAGVRSWGGMKYCRLAF